MGRMSLFIVLAACAFQCTWAVSVRAAEEEEKRDIVLPKDITKANVTFHKMDTPAKARQGQEKAAAQDNVYKNTARKTKTTYKFVHQNTDKPVPARWKTPSKSTEDAASEKKPSTAKNKTVIKKLEVKRSKYGDTSFADTNSKSSNSKDMGIPSDILSKIMGGKK